MSECFELFNLVHKVTDDLSAIRRVAREVVADYAAEGTVYLELRTTPRAVQPLAGSAIRIASARSYSPTPPAAPTPSGKCPNQGSSQDDYVDTVLQALNEASTAHADTSVGLLLSINRAQSSVVAEQTVRLARQLRHRGVLGIDFSGNPYQTAPVAAESTTAGT
eukprot:gene252-2384_t